MMTMMKIFRRDLNPKLLNNYPIEIDRNQIKAFQEKQKTNEIRENNFDFTRFGVLIFHASATQALPDFESIATK